MTEDALLREPPEMGNKTPLSQPNQQLHGAGGGTGIPGGQDCCAF